MEYIQDRIVLESHEMLYGYYDWTLYAIFDDEKLAVPHTVKDGHW